MAELGVSSPDEGARKVWMHCLRLNTGDAASIFYDETTKDTADVLIVAAESLGLQIKPRFVPLDHQAAFSRDRGLCGECTRALQGALGIITCVSDDTLTTPYRRELLRVGANGATRIGHMPGAKLFILEWATNVDYAHAIARCEALALALAEGNQATVKTHDVTGKAHTLSLQLGGRRRLPVVSTGIVGSGTWGNLPGGETFIAPLEDGSNGTIVINGGLKNHVMQPHQSVILTFGHGRLRDAQGDDESKRLFLQLFDGAIKNGDTQWNVLAELGIGVNEGIEHLTGNSLFDEKCAGTLHIALGDNKGFGGSSESCVHEDLITLKPSLWIDGKPILVDGAYAVDDAAWQDDIFTYAIDPRVQQNQIRLGRSPETVRTENGFLRFSHQVAAGRTCSYQVGTDATSRALAIIYGHTRAADRMSLDQLVERSRCDTRLPDDRIKAGISILVHHGLVYIAT